MISSAATHIAPTGVREAFEALLAYCRVNNWAGYDPYDALNSEVFTALPVLDSKWPRLVLTQLLKRSPLNLRPLLQVPKTQNPKALALFLAASLKAERAGVAAVRDLPALFIAKLIELRSPGSRYWCWGCRLSVADPNACGSTGDVKSGVHDLCGQRSSGRLRAPQRRQVSHDGAQCC